MAREDLEQVAYHEAGRALFTEKHSMALIPSHVRLSETPDSTLGDFRAGPTSGWTGSGPSPAPPAMQSTRCAISCGKP